MSRIRKFTEEALQQVVIPYLLYRGYDCVLPNLYINGWEADVAALGRSGYLSEYEIKVSRSDFRADFKKEAKHEQLVTRSTRCPNYFYYVCPRGMLLPTEVPEYAGLIHIDRLGGLRTIKKAPLLHKAKLPEKTVRRYWRNMNFRLWREVYAPPGWKPPKQKRTGRRRRRRAAR